MSYSKDDIEIKLTELLAMLAKHKKIIGGITAGAAVVSLAISLVLTPIFRAETKILPPQQGSSNIAAQLLNQMGGIATLASSAVGMKGQNEMYIGILRSRTVSDKMVDRFGLMKLYGVKYREDARNRLAGALTATSGKDGMIAVSVEDRDPKRAAEMANAFVEEMMAVSKGLAVTEAAQRRLFFEEQLKDVKMALVKAEEGARGFQEKTGALKIDDQARAVIQGIGTLRAQIAAKEVQYKVAQTYATSQNPDLQRIEEELRGLKSELNKLEQKGGSGHDPLMPTGRMPSVGMEYLRKLRDVKYNETLYELLAKQYELAKLDEARDAVVIQVVDRAIQPEKKTKPKRAFIVAMSTFTGFLFSIFLAVYIERVKIV
ncbi:MAG: Wzz/FepE/Etk N-terminal domain-containing protein [Deltaproteobacteria bacterium]|nr:Wzz/FepE/Etk N-terminal domain-containing protein [Deltaproteobacteria bacterium]